MTSIPSTPVFQHSLSPTATLTVDVAQDALSAGIQPRHRDARISSLAKAVRDKLVKDPNVELKRNERTKEVEYTVDSQIFENTVEDTITSIREAKNLLDALPDLQLVKDIIISSVLSPNDMISTELIYSSDSELFGDLTNDLVQYIKDYFDNEYQIPELLTEWLEKALFIEGALPIGVFPETAIDEAINSNLKITKEDYNLVYDSGNLLKPRSYGILGNPKYLSKPQNPRSALSLESFSAPMNALNYNPSIPNLNVMVVDNLDVLKTPLLIKKLRENRLSEAYNSNSYGLETYRKPLYVNNPSDNYPVREQNYVPVLNVKTLDKLDKPNVGHPAVFYFPMESVIPVYSPADPSDHVCYFVALDEFGNPIRADVQEDQITQMQNEFRASQSGSVTTQITQTAKNMGFTDYDKYNKADMEAMAKLYSQVIEKDLMDRMEAGGFNARDLKFSTATELYKLMLTRALKNMQTQLLFVPKEYMTYIAFDYKPNGVGRSLLDKTKVIGSLRMVNVVTDAIANTKSSIDHRKLEIKLDPNDPDPIKRVEQYIHEFQRATKAQFPMGINSYADITDYLQKAGVQVSITGHEGMPDMGMEFTNQRYDYNRPDESYDEKLSKKHTMGLGAPPESINSIEDIEFATQIISKNAFYAKINVYRQKIFSMYITDHVSKFTLNSQPLMSGLVEIIKANRDKLTKIDKKFSDEAAAIVFAKNIRVNLPKPDLAQIKMQSEAFQEYVNLLDLALPHFISSELVNTDMLGDKVSMVVDAAAAILKSFFARKWLADNNVVPELFNILNKSIDAEEKFEFLTEHENFLDALSPNLRDFVIKNMKRSGFNEGVVEKAEQLTGEDAGEGGDYSSDSSDSGGFDTGGDEEDDGDFGESEDEDMGGDDEDESEDSMDDDF